MQNSEDEHSDSCSPGSMSISEGSQNSSSSEESGSECSECGYNPCIGESSSEERVPIGKQILSAINEHRFDRAQALIGSHNISLSPLTRLNILNELVQQYINIMESNPKCYVCHINNDEEYNQEIDEWLNKCNDNDVLFIHTPSKWIKFCYNSEETSHLTLEELSNHNFYIHEEITDTKLIVKLEKIRQSGNSQFYQYQLEKELRLLNPFGKNKLDFIAKLVKDMVTLDIISDKKKLGISINGSQDGKLVPFNDVCYFGCTELAKIFLGCELLDIETMDEEGYDAIHSAILNHQYDILELLAEKLDPQNVARLTGSVKSRQLLSKALDVDFDAAPPPDERDYNSDSQGKKQFDEDYNIFIEEYVMVEIIKSLADQDEPTYRQHDNEFEGKTYLHVAIESGDILIVLKVLNLFYSHLSIRDDEQDQRCIEFARISAVKALSSDQLKLMENIRARINTCFRIKKITVNVENSLTEVLQYLHNDDLYILTEILDWNLFDKPIVTGIFPTIKENDFISNLASLKNSLFSVIKNRNNNKNFHETNRRLFTAEVLIYIIVRAAHELDDTANYSSGDDIDEPLEKEMQNKRDFELKQVVITESMLHAKTPENTRPKLYYEKDLLDTSSNLFVPVFRGINFKRDTFFTTDANNYEKNMGTQSEFFSHSSYTLLDRKPFQIDTSLEDLRKATKDIKAALLKIRDKQTCDLFSNKPTLLKKCSSLRMLIQRIYTEDIDGFNYHLFEKIVGDYEESESIRNLINIQFPLLSRILEENPFASGSAIPNHSVRYALGISRAFANVDLLLQPQYDPNGKPKHPCVGIVFIALYPIDEYLASDAIYVPQAWVNGEIETLKNHMQLLPEAEITFPGSLSHIVKSFSIFYPSFEDAHRLKVMDQFKFTNKQYEDLRKGITSKRGSAEYREALNTLREYLNKYYILLLTQWLEQSAQHQQIELRYQMPGPRGTNYCFTNLSPTPDEVTKQAEHYKTEGTVNANSKESIKANTQGSARFRSLRTKGPMDNFLEKKSPTKSDKPTINFRKRAAIDIFEGMRNHCTNVSGHQNNCGLYALALGTSLAIKFRDVLKIPAFIKKIIQRDVDGSNEGSLNNIGTLMRSELKAALVSDNDYFDRRKHSFIDCILTSANNQQTPDDMESFFNSNKNIIEKINATELLKNLETMAFEVDLLEEQGIDQDHVDYNKCELISILISTPNTEKIDKFNRFISYQRTDTFQNLRHTSNLLAYAWKNISANDADEPSRELIKESLTNWLIKRAYSFISGDETTYSEYYRLGETISIFSGANAMHWAKYLAITQVLNTLWHTVCKNYLDYIETQPVMLTADELGSLAKYWGIQLQIRTTNSCYIVTPQVQNENAPIKVKLFNSNNHWQVDNLQDRPIQKTVKLSKNSINNPTTTSSASVSRL